MNSDQLADLIIQKKWVALMALAIGLVVRLLKSDTKIPIDIPAQYRVWLALGLAPIAAAVDKVAAGNTWTTAMVEGVIAAAMAIVGHATVVDSIRGGKELPVPGLIKPGVPPGPGKPPTIPPPPNTPSDLTPPPTSSGPTLSRTMLARMTAHARARGMEWTLQEGKLHFRRSLFVAVACSLFLGCGVLSPAQESKGALVAWQIACVIENAFVDNDTLNALCKLTTPEQQAAAKQAVASTRAQVSRAQATAKAGACADGGAK